MRNLVFIPMYNCAAQIPRVLAQFDDPSVRPWVDTVLCIDNRSTDGTLDAARSALEHCPVPTRVLLRNDDNYGLGGSHKVAIEFARAHGYDMLTVLHGDDQGSITDLVGVLEEGAHADADFLMGARFMPGSRLEGYSTLRTLANRAFNLVFSAVSGTRLHDLGSGLNLMRVDAFADGFHTRFADDLTFNYYLILAVAHRKARLRFFPLEWREDDQISNARLTRMGFQILGLLGRRVISPRRFFGDDHRAHPRAGYPSTEIARWEV
ncbi:MAG: Glycosyltransferases involved in cell wall biogenesis [Rhodobacteraceae bacterium HLUCCO18]|nr:MAG: Glycosyltransferases involved in cell wall biogenesis [Rhodobacteraceae bacterium HLUCCO18]